MKSMLKLFASALLAVAALGISFSASAQSIGPNGQAQCGNTANMQSVDFWSARYVDLTPGAKKVIDRNGSVMSCTFATDSVFTYSEPAKRYVKVGAYLYQNVAKSSPVSCVAGQTVIAWESGGSETLNDSCSRASTVYSISRR